MSFMWFTEAFVLLSLVLPLKAADECVATRVDVTTTETRPNLTSVFLQWCLVALPGAYIHIHSTLLRAIFWVITHR